MKPSTIATRNMFLNETAISVTPRLIAEWEYNRFQVPTVTVSPDQPVESTPDQDVDDEWLPTFGDLDSVARPFRPRTGIAKARTDAGVRPLGPYRDFPNEARFYPAGYADPYTYFGTWQRSSLAADGTGAFPFTTPIQITVMYPEQVAANKVVVGFETSYAKPSSYSLQYTVDGTGWFDITTDSPLASDGTATLWYNGSQWDIVPVYDQAIAIMGVRVNVYSMNTGYSHLDVLQLGARLENDLSEYVIKYDTDFNVSSASFIAPFGKASSNQATVTLSNIDGRFNNMNTDSLYYQMIEKKVRFTLDLGVDATPQSGTKYEYIREFTMWTDTWGGQSSTEVEVQLKDSSVVLQEQTMPPLFVENYTVGGIVCLIMDTIGMTNYLYSRSEQDNGQLIPFYWPSDTNESSNPRWGRLMVNTTPPPTSTIWDEISAIAEATQTAIYFDENDVMQIVARKQMFGSGKPVEWNFDAIQNGSKLPDVVSADVNYDLTTNQVEFTYKPSMFSTDQNGLPRQEQVWQPTAPADDSIIPDVSGNATNTDVVLRGAPLAKDCLTTDDHLWITQPVAFYWPYESDVNIEGEILHYKGKEYTYYQTQIDGNTTTYVPTTKVIYSTDEKNALDATTDPAWVWKNSFTGKFMIPTGEDGLMRGLYGSYKANHNIDHSANYTDLLFSQDNHIYLPTGGLVTQHDGYITQYNQIKGGDMSTWGKVYHLRKSNTPVYPPSGSNSVWYGGKIRFTTNGIESTAGGNWRIGGFWFAGDNGKGGYLLEITATSQIDGWEQRQTRNELCLFAVPSAAATYQLEANTTDAFGNPTTDIKGITVGILDDQWYQVDLSYTQDASTGVVHIAVYLDGVYCGDWDVAVNKQPQQLPPLPPGQHYWRFGTHVRGPSTMDLEYLYAVGEDTTNGGFHTPDTTNFLDLVNGGFTSGFLERNVKYHFQAISPMNTFPGGLVSIPPYIGQGSLLLDEYGPVVHEIRTFDVAFDTSKVPCDSSFLYLSNPLTQALSYQSDAFGAEFMVANAARGDAIANGSEEIAGPTGTTNVTWAMFVYGHCLYTAQNDRYLTMKDDAAIRRQGLIRTQFTSRYIQTDDMATEIGQWVLDLWANGIDDVDVTLFGNPLLQLGDLVTMNYPLKGMFPTTHKYFVTEVKNTFDSGYKTEVKLRRAWV